MSSDSGILVDAFSPHSTSTHALSLHPHQPARRPSGAPQQHHQHPLTPPSGLGTLPTPPTSHIDISASTLPASATRMVDVDLLGDEDAPASSDVEVDASAAPAPGAAGGGGGANGSPSVVVTARRTARQSERSAAMQAAAEHLESGSSAAVGDTTITPGSTRSERAAALAEAEERTSRREHRRSNSDGCNTPARSTRSPSPPRDRSRTPSPILGEQEAHLSASTMNLLGPSPAEMAQLLFDVTDEEEEYVLSMKRQDIEEISALLQQMDVGQGEEGKAVEMARKLAQHSLDQDDHIVSLHSILHHVRLRAISSLTSQRTQAYASLTSTHLSLARQAAELEGARSQARMLGNKLARAEARVHEGERARARSVDEELRWADAMRGHAGAWAQQQAARAQAAAGAQALLQQQQQQQQAGLGAAFELDKPSGEAEDGEAMTGLGISANNAQPPMVQTQEMRDADESGPLASLVRERNKLLSDKRYLKSRVRDAEAQRERLENELKDLRPLLVRGGTKIIDSGNSLSGGAPFEGASSTTPAAGRHIKRGGSSRRKKAPTMGDAEAELLLLAARRMREVRRGEAHANVHAQAQAYAAYAAHPTLSPQKRSAGAASSARFEDTHHAHQYPHAEHARPQTPPPGAAPKTPRTPKTPRGSSVRGTPRSAGRSGLLDATMESGGARGAVPRWGLPAEPPFSTSSKAAAAAAAAAAAGNGIEDLLHAAQSLTPAEAARAAANGETQAHYFARAGRGELGESSSGELGDSGAEEGADLGSPKRRRVSTGLYELGPRAGLSLSPDKRALELGGAPASSRRVRTATEGAEPGSSQGLSALDLLADQAAASQQPSQASDRSLHSDERHSGHSSGENDELDDDDDEGMAVDEQPSAARWNAPTRPGPARYGGPPPFLPHQPPPPSNAAGYGYGPMGPQAHWASRTSGAAPYNYAGRGGPASPPGAAEHYSHASGSSKHAHLSQSGSSSQGSHSQTPPKPKGGNTSPDKRLPYIRWSEEEDRKLTKAIREHGQRWEAVARSVGTRSYHQCRQRALLMRRKGGGNIENAPTHGHPNGRPASP